MTTARRGQTASGVGAESSSGALTGYEAKLWQMADVLRGSMDAAEYKTPLPEPGHGLESKRQRRSSRS